MLAFIEKLLFHSKIEKLVIENGDLKNELSVYKKRCKELEGRLSGDRVCGEYCDKCKNVVIAQFPGCFPTRSCILNCKCKDFERI